MPFVERFAAVLERTGKRDGAALLLGAAAGVRDRTGLQGATAAGQSDGVDAPGLRERPEFERGRGTSVREALSQVAQSSAGPADTG